MKKIKAKVLKPDIRKIIYDGYEIKIDFNRKISVNGYIPIMAQTNLSDDKIKIITGIIDEDLNVVVPLRENVISKEELENKNFGINISIYQNGKALYETENNVYLIDLKTVKFNKENDNYIPSSYYFKFKCVEDIGNGCIIAYLENKAFIYDVVNNEIESFLFNYIKPSINYKGYYDAFFEKENDNVSPLLIHFIIDKGFWMSEEALLNEEALAVIPSFVNAKQEILKYCDDCYNTYCDFLEDGLCKTLH